MSFRLPDLIIESIIRDGLNNARRDETVIDDVFGDLTLPFAYKKYGPDEVEKIKKLIQNREVSIVHSFNLVPSNLPCISIQLSDDREDEGRAHMGNKVGWRQQDFTTPEQLAGTVIIEPFAPTSYDPVTGIVRVPDSVSLSEVHTNLVLVDAAGVQHVIIGGIDNDLGRRQFMIEKQGEVTLGATCQIKSQINYDIFQVRGNVEQTQLILGVHTKDPLTTKYLYILLKYFLLSRRNDLIERGLQLNTYTGSDFSRDLNFGADTVFTRFLNASGQVQHQWLSDKVQLIDSVVVNTLVDGDGDGPDVDLDRSDQSVQETE